MYNWFMIPCVFLTLIPLDLAINENTVFLKQLDNLCTRDTFDRNRNKEKLSY